MRSPKYLSVADYIQSQKEEYQPGLMLLRELVLGISSDLTETLKFNVPFFHYKKPFLFLAINKKRLALGFIGGHKLSNSQGLLQSQDLKIVRHIFLDPLSDIENWPLEAICETIEEAMEVAEESWKWKQ